MLALILGVVVATGQDLRSTAVDVSAIRVGVPVPIAELDLERAAAGRLFLLDREKRKQQVRGAKDALRQQRHGLPAE